VFAEITTPSLVIEDGAVFEGKCAMTGEGGAAAPRAADQPRLIEAAGAQGRATSCWLTGSRSASRRRAGLARAGTQP
jgi:hypothetical protein